MVTVDKEQITFVPYSCTLCFRSCSSEVAASWYGEVQQDFVGEEFNFGLYNTPIHVYLGLKKM
jgi:hypothetical protein